MKLFSKNPVKKPKSRQYSLVKQLQWKVQGWWRTLKQRSEGALVNFRGGYKCIDCGSTSARFKNPHYSGLVNGQRMMLDYTSYKLPFGKTVCPHCLANRIEQYWNTADVLEAEDGYTPYSSAGIFEGKCSWYGPGIVCGGIRHYSGSNHSAKAIIGDGYVIIGGQWWNGYSASLRAIKELLTDTGVAQTSVLSSSMRTLTGKLVKFDKFMYTDGRVYGPCQSVKEIK